MPRHILIILIGLIAVVSFAAAQPDTLWTKTFGGSGDDYGNCVQQTSDGGYAIVGYTDSYGAGSDDVYLIKTDSSGDTSWTKTFGGSNNDGAWSFQQTSDGGFIITGWTNSFGAGYYDLYLIKTDSSGDTSWTKTFGGSDLEGGTSVQQTLDNGYIIAGATWSFGAGMNDAYLIKTDEDGNEMWSRTFGGSGSEEAFSVQQTSDSGYVVVGKSYGYGASGNDIYLIKADSSGNMLWTRTFGGSYDDFGKCIQQTDDEGYIIAGYTYSYGVGGSDVYLIKTDSSGDTSWTKTFGGSDDDFSWNLQQTSDGGFIIAGWTLSYGAGFEDFYLIKTDASGAEQWSQTFGGSSVDVGYSVQQVSDGGYIVTGYTGSYGPGGADVWLIRMASEVGVKPQNPNQAYEFQLIPAYPNPFNPSTILRFSLPQACWVKLEVFDISGRLVGARHASPLLDRWMEAGRHQVTFDASDLASGLYIARIQAGSFTEAQKIVLMK